MLSGSLTGQQSGHPVPVGSMAVSLDGALVGITYLLLWLTLAVVLLHSRHTLRPRWGVVMFLVALVAESLVHIAETHGRVISFAPWLVVALKVVGEISAVGTLFSLPIYLRDLKTLALRAELGEQSEARLAVTTETSVDAIFIFRSVRNDASKIIDFTFTFVNRNGEQMLNSTRAEVLGQRVGELYPAMLTTGRIEQWATVVETDMPMVLESESPVLFSGNGPAYCRLQLTKLGDGIVITCTDLTSSRLVNQELKRALAFNKAIVLSSPFSIIVTDLDGRITSVNPAAERMLLYRSEELCGRSVMLLHDPEEVARRAEELSLELKRTVEPTVDVLRARASIGGRDEKEWTYLRKNGSRLPVQLTMSTMEDESGVVTGMMGMSYDLTERKDADDYIYHLAHHDTLTGLPGRSLLRDRLEVAIERGRRFQTIFAVLMIDLDHFKRVNDSLGHQAGDIVLCEVAERLKRLLRRVDTIARFGGDEFIVLISELQTREYAQHVARKIIKALTVPIRVFGHDLTVTASIGISMFPDSTTPDELIRHADIAMYRSKTLGRNDIVEFTPDLGQELMQRLAMESALRTAMERGEFTLMYQPQISLDTFALTGLEALIRWNNPDLGLVMPVDFIPIAEETGLIVEIGAWAVRTACREIAELERELGQPLMVAVNVSPRQVHQQNFQATIESALAESGLNPRSLEVEITEHLLMRDSEESLGIIERIQALGVTTAIDDFGTGFSNMSYITRFKVDRLKIDRSFVSRCVEDENSLAVTTAIIALAHSLNMRVVAEGVESADQAVMLRNLGCDFAQGYLYSRPLDRQALKEYASLWQQQISL
ncbi:EAL domain-containing protein [Granulicella sp. WH15]|uniref:putative bifunctional diguanylate cyclase/phosphodiesterase n=1 Tax=Granulicella sp. WH15 TaxID=2602070 RepID=UPI001C7049DD|nr:EAL domain-containing protein [Granulicella sp. WH15]